MGEGSREKGPSEYQINGGGNPCADYRKSVKMFEKFGVFTEAELESRAEILFEQYAQTINIEALATLDIAKNRLFLR